MVEPNYYQGNRDLLLNKSKEYYKNNRELILERVKDYQKEYRKNMNINKNKNIKIIKKIIKKYE